MYSIRKRKTLFNKHNNRKIAKMFLLNFTIAKVSELLEVFWNQVHHWNNKCMLHLFWGRYENIKLFPSPNIWQIKTTEDLSPGGDIGSVPLQTSGERDWSGCWHLSPSPGWEVMLSGYISPDPAELLDPTLLVSCYKGNFLSLKCSTQFTFH